MVVVDRVVAADGHQSAGGVRPPPRVCSADAQQMLRVDQPLQLPLPLLDVPLSGAVR